MLVRGCVCLVWEDVLVDPFIHKHPADNQNLLVFDHA